MDAQENEAGEVARPLYKATINSDFLQHPESGGFFRNPLKERRTGLLPTMLSEGEFKHNGMGEVLKNSPCIKISEAGFWKLMAEESRGSMSGASTMNSSSDAPSTATGSSISSAYSTPRSNISSASGSSSARRKLPLSRLPEVSMGCEIHVNVFVQPTHQSHHHEHHTPSAPKKDAGGKNGGKPGPAPPIPKEMQLENLSIDVTGVDSSQLVVGKIRDGAVAKWNRVHPELQVKLGDSIVRVNGHRRPVLELAHELAAASGNVALVVRRNSIATGPKRLFESQRTGGGRGSVF